MHGGDVYRNKVKYDFSVNVNPNGMPLEVQKTLIKAVSYAEKYPDINNEELINTTAKTLNISADRIIFGNGASELIMAVCNSLKPQKVMMTAPSFLGYEIAVKKTLQDSHIIYNYLEESSQYQLTEGILKQIEKEKPELLFLTNPNNPNGLLIDKKLLIEIINLCENLGITVLVDECFLPLTGQDKDRSLINKTNTYSKLIILRAFTKTFAMAGVRLGYAVCGSLATKKMLENQLPEWNLSIFAQIAGIEALNHTDYINESVQYIKKEKTYLIQNLTNLGLKVYPSDANYILFKSNTPELKDKLLEEGILIRDCSDYKGLDKGSYRIAIRNHQENIEFTNVIENIINTSLC